MSKQWIPLESNPDVLNLFANKMGFNTSKYSFQDVFSLDEELLSMVPQPVLAVMMLFPITPETEKIREEEKTKLGQDGQQAPDQVYYMKQTIGNACGTIAVLHSLLNNPSILQFDKGSFLDVFYDSTKQLTPEKRGESLENPSNDQANLEDVHKEMALQGQTEAPDASAKVNLHFVAFVHVDGTLYELDGRKAGPIAHGPCTQDTLLSASAVVVKKFMELSNSVQFTLMALAPAQP